MKKLYKSLVILFAIFLLIFVYEQFYNRSSNLGKEIVCNDLELDRQFCVSEKLSADEDYWGRNAVTTYYVKSKGDINILYSSKGFAPQFLGISQKKDRVYYSRGTYEGAGEGVVWEIDLVKNVVTNLPINAYGYISNNKKYYATNGDTLNQNGLSYCESVENNYQRKGSAIKILDFDSGNITTLLEDKSKIFVITGWSKDENKLFYRNYDVIKNSECNNLGSYKESEIIIK